ncbi:hypothetical protein BJ875DRAFT_439136 [Amylocarpus encephaloides]|uniref:Uncharacterized protein n=1 Tax=Amylocarpus encephaloides TaxID=45428 RepID=A0A9P7YP80_9HELO|nr:hypothetical protein BJ875DRAFT_439136 [Amylocarpus encephaloides]
MKESLSSVEQAEARSNGQSSLIGIDKSPAPVCRSGNNLLENLLGVEPITGHDEDDDNYNYIHNLSQSEYKLMDWTGLGVSPITYRNFHEAMTKANVGNHGDISMDTAPGSSTLQANRGETDPKPKPLTKYGAVLSIMSDIRRPKSLYPSLSMAKQAALKKFHRPTLTFKAKLAHSPHEIGSKIKLVNSGKMSPASTKSTSQSSVKGKDVASNPTTKSKKRKADEMASETPVEGDDGVHKQGRTKDGHLHGPIYFQPGKIN